MNYPLPRPGMVIRYSFLWSREARAGQTEGRKDRPCAIVLAADPNKYGDLRVAVVPITHAGPNAPSTGFALPPEVKKSLGLDAEAAWVCLDELNVFAWPGHDLRPIPRTNRIDYGVLPLETFEKIRRGVIDLHRLRQVRQVSRD